MSTGTTERLFAITNLDPALAEAADAASAGTILEGIIRLEDPSQVPPDFRVVSRFHRICTGRFAAGKTWTIRRHPNVISLKASRPLGLHDDGLGALDRFDTSGRVKTRNETRAFKGRGCIVAALDFGLDFAHPNFLNADGTTRLLAFWDQGAAYDPARPNPFGYGRQHGPAEINAALSAADPYRALGYGPQRSDTGNGSHGTHTLDIAAGNGRAAGSRPGAAPEAGLMFVHLSTRRLGTSENLGDSVRLLEALDWVDEMARGRPWAVNLSVGSTAGSHDGTSPVEQGMHELLRASEGKAIIQSAGNYRSADLAVHGHLDDGEYRDLDWIIDPSDTTPNEVDAWYSGKDRFVVALRPPHAGADFLRVRLGEVATIVHEGAVVGRIYHRKNDPNNGDNHVAIFLYANAPAGTWTLRLTGDYVINGRYHAWIERTQPGAQSRFDPAISSSAYTLGTIATSPRVITVGAYDAHADGAPLAPFSSCGPTRDERRDKPELLAPGVDVLAARSIPRGAMRQDGLLVERSGTSMAAPHVTGVAAAMFEAAGRPVSLDVLRECLKRSARPHLHAEDTGCSAWGRLDATAALRAMAAWAESEPAVATEWIDATEIASADARIARQAEPKACEGRDNVMGNLDRTERLLQLSAAGKRDSETWFLHGLLREIDPEAPPGMSPAQLFQTLLRPGLVSERMRRIVDIVAKPFERLDQPLRPGDVMLRATPGTGDTGHVMVLASSDLRPAAALAAEGIAAESTMPGQYGTVIEAGAFPHDRSTPYARRWLDGRGRIPPNSLILRANSHQDDPYPDLPAVGGAPDSSGNSEPLSTEDDSNDLASAPRDYSLRDIADSDNLSNATRAAILRDGKTNTYNLTDQAFWARHPDMKGQKLESTGARHKALREEYGAMAQQVDALIWLRKLIDELDKHRGDIPREFLLGWMAVESDGSVGVVTSRPERGYFQIDWPGGEASEQLGLTEAQFRKLSTDRVFSIEKGVALVEKYRQFILRNFSQVPDRTELLWRLTKGRHAASASLSDAVQGLLKSGTAITWDNVAAQVPAFLRNNVNLTWQFATKLKPFADLPGSAAPAAPSAESVPGFEEQATPDPTRTRVRDPFAVPFRWMARVSLQKRGSEESHGSGVLISDVHVLTAAHVVWEATVSPAEYSVSVTLAQDGGNSIDTIGVSRIDVPTRYKDGANAFDYSILTLSSPVADRTYRELGGAKLCYWGSSACGAGTTAKPVDPASLNGQVAITAGYPRDKGGKEMWVATGTMSHSVGGTVAIQYTSALIEGQSGSPAWIEQNGERNIVGIAVSRGTHNRLYPLSWDMVLELNGWMLRAEKTDGESEAEFRGDQSEDHGLGVGGGIVLRKAAEGELEEDGVEPKGLALLDHVHIPKAPDPLRPGKFKIGTSTKLVAADLNPQFYDSAHVLKLDSSPTGLQTCLDAMMKNSFGSFLSRSGQTSPHPDDVAHVAVVDLTGAKRSAPEFAAWGASVDMYGASVPKILALYAAFQLRSDLRDLITRKSPSDGKQLEAAAIGEWNAKGYKTDLPDLIWLFDVRKWTPPSALDFAPAARDAFANIVHNCPAGTLIAKVGMPFIGSVAWQSGLYHPMSSGLWLRASYCDNGAWASPVKTPWVHNVTALSAATYFTLLAQGRLVDEASSKDIKNALRGGCITRAFPSLPVIASKCGWYDGWIHDCAWIQDGDVRYVMAVLSHQTKPAQEAVYTQLCAQIDTLVRSNNQTPKASCS